MKMRWMAAAALALSAACGGGSAPPEDGPAPRGGRGGFEGGGMLGGGVGGGGPNVFALIGAREQLGLTGAQVTALDSIGRAWSVRNDTLTRQIRGRPGERRTMGEVQPALVAMAENNETANRAVEALLTEEQRRISCTLPGAQADARRSGPPGGRIAEGRGNRMRSRTQRLPGGDTLAALRMRRGWPWCATAAPADSAR